MFYIFDDDMIGVLIVNFCIQCNQEVCGIDDFWFMCCVFNNCGVFCQGCSIYDGYCCVNVDFIYYDMCVFQMIIDGSFNVIFFQFDGCV